MGPCHPNSRRTNRSVEVSQIREDETSKDSSAIEWHSSYPRWDLPYVSLRLAFAVGSTKVEWKGYADFLEIMEPVMQGRTADESTSKLPSESTLVSIVIPCYEQAHLLPEAIESVLRQTNPNMEVVVVDDGSPDNTAEVVARYAGVRYIRQANQGLGGARNTGFRISKGEYVGFLDADDRLMPSAVAAHLACFAQHPEAGFVVGDIDHIQLDGSYAGSPRWPVLERNHYEELLRANHVANTIAVMFRRAVIDRVGGFRSVGSPAEDYELLLRAARLFPSAHHRNVVAEYRRYPASLSRQGTVMLGAMHRVMQMQLPVVQGNLRLTRAWRQGDCYWRDHFGIATFKELFSRLRSGEIMLVLRALGILVWRVRFRLLVIPWRYPARIIRALAGQGRARCDQGDRRAVLSPPP